MSRIARSPAWPLVAVLLALFLAYDLGAAPLASGITANPLAISVVRVKFIPDPNEVVNLAEGTPFTVPVGRVLIITDWAVTNAELQQSNDKFAAPRIRVGGNDAWGGGFYASGGMGSTGGGFLSGGLSSGIRANAGQTVTLFAGANYAGPTMFASGYLADAKP